MGRRTLRCTRCAEQVKYLHCVGAVCVWDNVARVHGMACNVVAPHLTSKVMRKHHLHAQVRVKINGKHKPVKINTLHACTIVFRTCFSTFSSHRFSHTFNKLSKIKSTANINQSKSTANIKQQAHRSVCVSVFSTPSMHRCISCTCCSSLLIFTCICMHQNTVVFRVCVYMYVCTYV